LKLSTVADWQGKAETLSVHTFHPPRRWPHVEIASRCPSWTAPSSRRLQEIIWRTSAAAAPRHSQRSTAVAITYSLVGLTCAI